jgi:hypothetical protein
VVKNAGTCLCSASACASACDKTFCKAGASKDPDDACAACLHDALAGPCSTEVDVAKGQESQATPYMSCAAGCP